MSARLSRLGNMTSPRVIALSAISAATLLGLTGCGTSGNAVNSPSSALSVSPLTSAPAVPTTAPATPAMSPTPTASTTPTVITYPGDGLNVSTKNVHSVLTNTSPAFQAFIVKQLHTLWKQGGSVPGCQSSALIVLSTYSSAGYAGASDEGIFGAACARGGSNALYAEVGGTWQEIAATQAGYDCSVLAKYKVPVSIAGPTCSDAAGNSQPYSG